LLQSGKGGGLAAIGGLGDQSAFGTRTNTFITKITYLIGAAFIVTTIFLFKLSIPEKTIQSLVTSETQAEHHSHNHAAHDHDEKCEHDHEHAPHAGGKKDEGSGLGMQNVTGEKQTDAQSQTK
jgi:protein translocase SecG subunit